MSQFGSLIRWTSRQYGHKDTQPFARTHTYTPRECRVTNHLTCMFLGLWKELENLCKHRGKSCVVASTLCHHVDATIVLTQTSLKLSFHLKCLTSSCKEDAEGERTLTPLVSYARAQRPCFIVTVVTNNAGVTLLYFNFPNVLD